MRRLIEYRLSDDSEDTLVVEVDEALSEQGEERAARAGEVERAHQSFGEALERVRPAADALVAKLRGLAEPPDEATIEFGIKLTGKAGAVLASAAVEANYKVTLTWKRGADGSEASR